LREKWQRARLETEEQEMKRMKVKVSIAEFTWRDAAGLHTVRKGRGEVPGDHPEVQRALKKGWIVEEAEQGQPPTGDTDGQGQEAEGLKSAEAEELKGPRAGRGKKRTGGK
jgi:hypothetical protein